MRRKYTPYLKGSKPGERGRNSNPNGWLSGPDPIDHEKYYAFLKHRAQARFRGEPYELDWAAWQTLWPTELFLMRGRGAQDLCLQRVDPEKGWQLDNCEVVTRYEHLVKKRKRELDGTK